MPPNKVNDSLKVIHVLGFGLALVCAVLALFTSALAALAYVIYYVATGAL